MAYLSGSRFHGYVVPDVQREWAIRNAIESFKKMQILFGYFVATPIMISIFFLGGRYSSFALAVLTVTLAIAAIGEVATAALVLR